MHGELAVAIAPLGLKCSISQLVIVSIKFIYSLIPEVIDQHTHTHTNSHMLTVLFNSHINVDYFFHFRCRCLCRCPVQFLSTAVHNLIRLFSIISKPVWLSFRAVIQLTSCPAVYSVGVLVYNLKRPSRSLCII